MDLIHRSVSLHRPFAIGIFLLIVCAAGILAATTSSSNPKNQGANVKKSFVFIFRKGKRTLSEEEEKRRTEEVRAWALQEAKAHELEPRILGDESYYLGDSDKGSSSDGTVIALNFIKAEDFDEAVKVAKSHPGLRYGVSIEVRPWADPRAQPAPK
jgi:hypothetical protein